MTRARGGASNGMRHAVTTETSGANLSKCSYTHWLIWLRLSNGDFLHCLHCICYELNKLSLLLSFLFLLSLMKRCICFVVHLNIDLKISHFLMICKRLYGVVFVWWSTLSCYVFSLIRSSSLRSPITAPQTCSTSSESRHYNIEHWSSLLVF